MARSGRLPISRKWLARCPDGHSRGILPPPVRRRIQDPHQIDWKSILPLAAIAKSQHEKIRRFQAQQLERGYRKGISLNKELPDI
jgi:hypothetical protein